MAIINPLKHLFPPAKGIALVVVLIALSLLTLLGLTTLLVGTTDIMMLTHQKNSLANLYTAESAVEEARSRIKNLLVAGELSLTDTDKCVYLVSAPGINPTTGSEETNIYFDETYSAGLTVSLLPSQFSQLGGFWVKILPKTEARAGYSLTNSRPLKTDPVFYGYHRWQPNAVATQYVNAGLNRTNYAGSPVFLVTAMARDREGGGRAMQADVALMPLPLLGAAFYCRDSIVVEGGQVRVNGDDENLSQGQNLGGMESQGDIAGDLSNVQGTPLPVRARSSYSYNIESLLRGFRPPVGKNIEQAAARVLRLPGGSYSGEGLALGQTPDTGDVAETIFVGGGLSLSNSTGQGILIVNGNLTVTGSLVYYGLIIVKGTVSMTGTSLPGVEIHGALLSDSGDGRLTSHLGGNVWILNNSGFLAKGAGNLSVLRLAIRSLY